MFTETRKYAQMHNESNKHKLNLNKKVQAEAKFTLGHAMKTQKERSGIALLFL
jgi:hypothetical protein